MHADSRIVALDRPPWTEKGLPIGGVYHVSRLLGHESLDTLQHYARLDVTDLRKTHHLTHPRERDEEARGR